MKWQAQVLIVVLLAAAVGWLVFCDSQTLLNKVTNITEIYEGQQALWTAQRNFNTAVVGDLRRFVTAINGLQARVPLAPVDAQNSPAIDD